MERGDTMNEILNNNLLLLNKRKKNLIIIAIVLIVLIAIVLVIYFNGYYSAKNKYENIVKQLEEEVDRLSDPIVKHEIASQEVSLDLIKSEISDIGELATIEYLYTNAGKYEDAKQLFGMDVIGTTKSFIAKWDGIIKAGVQIDKIIVEINDANKEIIVHMPKAEILSHEIDNDSIETLDQKNGLFNAVKVEDVREFDAISKEEMEQRAIENGILDKAYENAKDIIEKLINNDVVKEQGYTIKFEVIE